ncbi:adenine phosphoribosyltransferase [Chloroflexota bacterium]
MYHHNSGLVTNESEDEFKQHIRNIHDFPKKGIIFRDITNFLKNGDVFKKAVDIIAYKFSREEIDIICSVEARGFILGSAIAHALGAGFVPIRKKGKLPWNTHQKSYDLEYGQDELEIHTDAVSSGNHVLFVDDVIATGGTAKAAVELIKKMQGKLVSAVFLIELTELKGRTKLEEVSVYSLMRY